MEINMQGNMITTQIADNVKFSGTIESGFYWDALTKERMRDPKALESYGYKVYSQNDEDGIIHEIFRRIGTKNKTFIEFGVQNGLESNCHLLLFYGWRGLWIEGAENCCREMEIKFRPVIENGQLKVANRFITKDNINEIFMEEGYSGEIDLLSIDIDGNDLYVWDAIKVVNPRCVIVEYNGKFPPDLEWKQAYNPTHIWRIETDWQGASLKAFEILGRNKGYQLVGTNLRGCNAFFIRNDLISDLFYEPATAEALYNPLRMNLRFISNHAAEYCLVAQKANLGVFNYQSYELAEGFHREESGDDSTHAWTSATKSVLRLLVSAETKAIEIPYFLPEEVIAQVDCYEILIYVNGCEMIKQKIDNFVGTWIIPIDFEVPESILELTICTPLLWKPCDILGAEDSRNLGINIVLSKIKMIKDIIS